MLSSANSLLSSVHSNFFYSYTSVGEVGCEEENKETEYQVLRYVHTNWPTFQL